MVDKLKEEASKAETVWLASDEDREGEAISWHLYEVPEIKTRKYETYRFSRNHQNSYTEGYRTATRH
ncbi:toprim domain-containing protein [Bacteroides fragilis]|nr:toprim domain-containing protein [Bacteroides fragilis]